MSMTERDRSVQALIWIGAGILITVLGLVLDPLGGAPDPDLCDDAMSDDEIQTCLDSASALWASAVVLLALQIVLGGIVIWISAIQSSAERQQWVWFAIIVAGTPLVASFYFILDKTGWGGFDKCGECW